MKLYLFGGAETDQGQAPILKELINNVLLEIKPQQLLHIPYARLEIPKGEEDIWGEGWIKMDLNLEGVKLLDARNEEDLKKAEKPAIFMNGGPQGDLLYEKITSNKLLYNLVTKADFIIGESAGSVICAELGILKDTVVAAHYTERKRQKLLRDEMKETGAKYGIGIDSITGIVIDTDTYPEEYRTFGHGSVEFVKLH